MTWLDHRQRSAASSWPLSRSRLCSKLSLHRRGAGEALSHQHMALLWICRPSPAMFPVCGPHREEPPAGATASICFLEGNPPSNRATMERVSLARVIPDGDPLNCAEAMLALQGRNMQLSSPPCHRAWHSICVTSTGNHISRSSDSSALRLPCHTPCNVTI